MFLCVLIMFYVCADDVKVCADYVFVCADDVLLCADYIFVCAQLGFHAKVGRWAASRPLAPSHGP